MKKIALTSLVCLSLTSCGFTPMHGSAFQERGTHNALIKDDLRAIKISNIPDRAGQYLRNALIDRFHGDGQSQDVKYILDVAPLQERVTDLDITRESDTTRSQIRVATVMTLRDAMTREALLSRDLSVISSYNVLDNEFATRVSAENTRENALNDIARQIELQISLYLKR